MKKIQHLIVLMAVLTIAWGCSSDGDDTNPPSHPRYTVMEAPTAPSWDYIKDINWMSDEPLPDWAAPDPLQFESTMVLQVKLDEDLFSYASDKDLMSVTKGEECRALSLCNFKEVQGTGESVAYFILAIKGNNDERDALLSVNYYCENLKQTFVMKDIMPFVPDLVYGIYDDSENFQPYFSNILSSPLSASRCQVTCPSPCKPVTSWHCSWVMNSAGQQKLIRIQPLTTSYVSSSQNKRVKRSTFVTTVNSKRRFINSTKLSYLLMKWQM